MKIGGKIYMTIIFVLLYAPIIVLMFFSFNESNSMAVFTGFSLKWYRELFAKEETINSLMNTLILAVSSSILATAIGTAAAVGIHSLKSRHIKSLVMNVTNIPMMNPDIVTGVSLMLLFAFVGTLMHHGILGFWTPVQAFFKVEIHEIIPGIATGMLMAFTLSLDDFVISYFAAGNSFQTLPIYIYAQTKKRVTPDMNALCSIIFVVILILLLVRNFAYSREERKNGKKI